MSELIESARPGVSIGDGAAATPDGLRIYALGDIHGRFDMLQSIAAEIRRDLEAAPPVRSLEIFIGDYIDRGPESAAVVDWLARGPLCCDERICLLGNHEDMLLSVLATPDWLDDWLMNGGMATLRSYGVDTSPRVGDPEALRAAFIAALPPEHRAFVEKLPRSYAAGGYLFVHAGLRPGLPPDRQDPHDLVWIREPFLSSAADFGAMVVHGHTPAPAPEVRPNRINIDTGAVFGGRLTCLALDGATRRIIQVAG